MDATLREATLHSVLLYRLENDSLRISVQPQVGAKVYDLPWKSTGQQFLWHSPRIRPQCAPIVDCLGRLAQLSPSNPRARAVYPVNLAQAVRNNRHTTLHAAQVCEARIGRRSAILHKTLEDVLEEKVQC